jgi:hypothetical protein
MLEMIFPSSASQPGIPYRTAATRAGGDPNLQPAILKHKHEIERGCPSRWSSSCSTRGSGSCLADLELIHFDPAVEEQLQGTSPVICMTACGHHHITRMRSEGYGAGLCLHRGGIPGLAAIDGVSLEVRLGSGVLLGLSEWWHWAYFGSNFSPKLCRRWSLNRRQCTSGHAKEATLGSGRMCRRTSLDVWEWAAVGEVTMLSSTWWRRGCWANRM